MNSLKKMSKTDRFIILAAMIPIMIFIIVTVYYKILFNQNMIDGINTVLSIMIFTCTTIFFSINNYKLKAINKKNSLFMLSLGVSIGLILVISLTILKFIPIEIFNTIFSYRMATYIVYIPVISSLFFCYTGIVTIMFLLINNDD